MNIQTLTATLPNEQKVFICGECIKSKKSATVKLIEVSKEAFGDKEHIVVKSLLNHQRFAASTVSEIYETASLLGMEVYIINGQIEIYA